MTRTDAAPPAPAPSAVGATPRFASWALAGTLAGALGFFATILTDVHVPGDDGDQRMTVDMVDDVSIMKARLGFLAGYAVVGLLLYCAAAWRRHVEPRVPDSTAARLVATGFTASAGALTLGYGWKGAMAIYGDGGPEDNSFDRQGRFVYYVLNDFGGFIGWTGVMFAAMAVVWMAFRERSVARWIGAVSVLGLIVPVGGMLIMSVPGLPGTTLPLWMIVAFSGFAFGKSPATRPLPPA